MSCRELVQLFLADWLRGDVPPRRALACARHVARCPACAAYTQSYLRTVAMIGSAAAEPQAAVPPEDLIQSILGRAAST